MNRLLTAGLVLVFAAWCSGACTNSVANSNGIKGPLPSDAFSNHQELSAGFDLYWNFNSTHIIFQTQAKNNGYTGFGISKNGGMFPADVILAWTNKDGKSQFGDRHATGYFLPPLDSQQDWTLVSGSEASGLNTYTMIRALNTCDKDDIEIKSGSTHVIWSTSMDDPSADGTGVPYHGVTRGSASITLVS